MCNRHCIIACCENRFVKHTMIAYVRCLHIVSGHTVLQEGFTTMYLPSIPLLSVFVRSPSFKAALLSGWLWPPLLWLLVLACSASLLPLLLLYRTFSTPCSPCAGAAWWWSWALAGLGKKAWLWPLWVEWLLRATAGLINVHVSCKIWGHNSYLMRTRSTLHSGTLHMGLAQLNRLRLMKQ